MNDYAKRIKKTIEVNKPFSEENFLVLTLSHLIYLDIDFHTQAFDDAIEELEDQGYTVFKIKVQFKGNNYSDVFVVDTFQGLGKRNYKPQLIIKWED